MYIHDPIHGLIKRRQWFQGTLSVFSDLTCASFLPPRLPLFPGDHLLHLVQDTNLGPRWKKRPTKLKFHHQRVVLHQILTRSCSSHEAPTIPWVLPPHPNPGCVHDSSQDAWRQVKNVYFPRAKFSELKLPHQRVAPRPASETLQQLRARLLTPDSFLPIR